jgi:rhamnopyranosyl-N-acetylglucosaminyl-diphospho-decaprenol beta-1,3/1,4-galactofuranosyltransferase
MNVFAVIVTFNRPHVLKNCIDSLAAQKQFGLDHVHVVVNSRDAETPALLNDFQHLYPGWISFQLQDNAGPAGGFYFGIKTFLDSDAQYAWLMDDDIIVENSCLRFLLEEASTNDFVFPKVIMSNGNEVVSFGWWGVLLKRTLIEKVGLPIKDLFYWAEDTEYLQNRIKRQNKVQPARSNFAIVHHLHNRSDKKPTWYYYYTARNTLLYNNYIAGYTWYRFKRTIYLFPYLFYQILVKEDRKLSKIKLLMYGTMHGMIGRSGKTIDPFLYP